MRSLRRTTLYILLFLCVSGQCVAVTVRLVPTVRENNKLLNLLTAPGLLAAGILFLFVSTLLPSPRRFDRSILIVGGLILLILGIALIT